MRKEIIWAGPPAIRSSKQNLHDTKNVTTGIEKIRHDRSDNISHAHVTNDCQ